MKTEGIYLPAFDETEEIKEALPAFEETQEIKEAPATEDNFLMDSAKTGAATLLGLGQGVSFNFGDELLAALEYAAKGGSRPYQEIQKEYEQAYKKIQQESPIATGIGEFAGGMLIPGGAVVKAGKTGAGLLGKAVTGGIAGAAASVISQAGATEKDIGAGEIPKEELIEAAKWGGGLGAGLPIAGAGLSKIPLKEYVDASPILKRALAAFELEKGGTNLTEASTKKGGRTSGPQKVIQQVEDVSDRITDSILNVKNTTGGDIATHLAQQTDAIEDIYKGGHMRELLDRFANISRPDRLIKQFGVNSPVKIVPVLDGAGKVIGRKLELVEGLSVADLNEAYKVMKGLDVKRLREIGLTESDINWLLSRGQPKNKQGKTVIGSIKDVLSDALDEFDPQLKEFKNNFFVTSRLGELVMNEIKTDPEAITKNISEISNAQLRVYLQRVLNTKIKMGGSVSVAGDVAFRDLYSILDAVKDYNKQIAKRNKLVAKQPMPGAFEKGLKKLPVSKLEKDIKDAAVNYSALVASKGQEATQDIATSNLLSAAYGGVGPMSSLLLSSGVQVAGKAGRAMTKQPVKFGVDSYNKMYSAVDKMSRSDSFGTKKLGEVLKTALDNKMAAGSVTQLNTLLQQDAEAREAYRKMEEESKYPVIEEYGDKNYPNIK